jgi:glycosyltransferase involved in cell wall biosynthesis
MFDKFQPMLRQDTLLRVAHVGTVYPTATPRYYLDALDSLDDDARERIETHFVGRVTAEERGALSDRKSRIIEHGFVPQHQAVGEMEKADVLLLTMTDPKFTSGKIYDYLATGKPILAISPRGGEVDDVLRQTGGGWLADPNEPGSVNAALTEILSLHAAGRLSTRSSREAVDLYARPSLIRGFAERLHALAGHSAGY